MTTYVTRAQIGLRKPTNSTALVPAAVLNTAFHYPGMASTINAVGDAGFRRVCSALRGWQAYHMDTRGWSDIAYCVAIDQVGRAYTLRGINIKSGANGDNTVNQKYGAVLLVLGNNEEPSAAMAATARAVMQDYRVRFSRIPRRPTWHGAIRPGGTASDPSTDCPGKRAITQIKAGKFDAASTPIQPPTTPTIPADVWEEIMALFNTKEEYIAATSEAVFQGNYKYWRAFFANEVGTGDAMLDDMRAFYAREAASDVAQGKSLEAIAAGVATLAGQVPEAPKA